MSADIAGLSFVILGLLLLLGYWIRLKVEFFQKYFIPSSVIAGFIGLILGPQVLGALTGEEVPVISNGFFPQEMVEVWKEIPGLFITLIFATIFLGKKIQPVKKVWEVAGPQMAFGQTIAWGQYVVGILVVLLVLVPFFDIHPSAAALIEISFQGGMGTATGLAPTFESIGFSEARDLGVGLATIGLTSGLILGIVILNWGIKHDKTSVMEMPKEKSGLKMKGLFDNMPSAGKLTTRTSAIETLSIHFAFIAAAIFVGFLLLEMLQVLENNTWGAWTDFTLMEHFPLFPLALIGSVIVQKFLDKYSDYPIISHKLIKRINGFALDVMVVSAIASLSLTVIGNYIVPFLLLATAGVAWNLLAFFFIARKILPDHWFERGICDFGQSMGMTALGLLLVRLADPENKSPALEGFAYKQIIFEPIVGGGLFTAASAPLIAQWGLIPVLILTASLGIGWFLFGYFRFGKKANRE
ncbi:sodium/glutamate symporter [Salinimicrobium xinjiangense]|uniref:sodium/glutamate symporter n=1 Tax=Salinimicrobium xinjiangense TaxID=438596 RepID=UPI0004022056|nr:sodium/glutamate symporter [Salinimicrobium xinjiangense]